MSTPSINSDPLNAGQAAPAAPSTQPPQTGATMRENASTDADKPSTPTSSGSSPFGGSAAVVAAPVPLKPYRASSQEEWERELQPAIPDAPAVAGMQQYYARDLLRIRRAVVEACTLGAPPA